jgi:hypothetical protein
MQGRRSERSGMVGVRPDAAGAERGQSATGPSRLRRTDDEAPMSADSIQPATTKHAVERAVRLLRFQFDLSHCSVAMIERDAFAAGYLWGFCGGTLAAMDAKALGLFPMFSMVCRSLFGERDGPRVLATIHRVLTEPAFEDGEAAGLADAWRSFDTDRAPVGLLVHLTGDGPQTA